MTMTGTRKAIIIGGGPAGLATALRIQQKTNISCTIYELRPQPTTIGGALGIVSNGTRLLDRLGVYDALRTRGNTCGTITVHSLAGKALGSSDITRSAEKTTGYGYMRIKRRDLQDVLLNAVHKAGISIHFDKRITSITETGESVDVRFSDGSADSADLLLGCDGIHSAVRRLYVDPGQIPEYSGMSGLGSVIPTSTLSASTASQIEGMNATITQKGMFLAMNCTASSDEVYWGYSRQFDLPETEETRDGWEVHRKEEVEGFKDTLKERLEGAGGEWGDAMRDIVDKTEVVGFYPIYKLPAGGAWSKGRCLLIGDAAHAMPPHAGQGVGMALEDAFLVARLLEDPQARSVEEAFARFEQIRKPRVDDVAQRAAQNGTARRDSGPWGLWAKEMGIWLFMHGAGMFGLDRWGSETRHMVYDVEDEVL